MVFNDCDAIHSLIQNAHSAAQFFILSESYESGTKLDEALTKLIHESSSVSSTGRLSLKLSHSTNITEFLGQCKQLLMSSSTSPSTRSKLRLVLFNFSLHNISIRKFLAGELQLCSAIYNCLQTSLVEQLGPQNLIDILRLLQVLTYEKALVLGNWTNELLNFLTSEILREDEMEWLPYCCAILSNLVSRSKTLCGKLKKSNIFKRLCKKLLELLQNNSRMVVICSLVLIGHLDERTRDVIFSTQNSAQTFLCIFNVLGSGEETLMTVHIAVDLLERLVVSYPRYGHTQPTITAIAKNFTSYNFFKKSMQRIGSLLMSFDFRSQEESWKIYNLLLSFCKLKELRGPVCSSVIEKAKLTEHLTTPILSICRAAMMPFEELIRPEISLNALDLLIFHLQEAIDEGVKISELVPIEKICLLVETCVKTPIETKSADIHLQCARVTKGLRLSEVLAGDEEVRIEILEVISAPLCSHINESQFVSNPIVNFFARSQSEASQSNEQYTPDWSIHGCEISLQLLRLLASLKDFSKTHKDLYWRTMKDERIIPFIAFAIACGKTEIIHDALFIFTHCAQVQEFPIQMLGKLIAIAAEAKQKRPTETSQSCSQNGHRYSLESSLDMALLGQLPSSNGSDFSDIDDLLEQMKKGINLKDVSISKLVLAFEKKIELHKGREGELEKLIAVKEQALSQSEHLRNTNWNRESGPEVANLRQLLNEVENRCSEYENEIVVLNREKACLVDGNKKLQQQLENERMKNAGKIREIEDEKCQLASENEKERELHGVLRKKFNDVTSKFDLATKAIFEKQLEVERNAKNAAEAQRLASETKSTLEETRKELTASRENAAAQGKLLEEQRKEMNKLSEENETLNAIKQLINK